MDYWQTVLLEYLHRHDQNYKFIFTNLGNYSRQQNESSSVACQQQTKHPRYQVMLGGDYPDVHFTFRESQTMYLLCIGHTMVSLSKILKLSVRTIEFYVKNMKSKLGVRTKKELVHLIKTTEFMHNYQMIIDKSTDEENSH